MRGQGSRGELACLKALFHRLSDYQTAHSAAHRENEAWNDFLQAVTCLYYTRL